MATILNFNVINLNRDYGLYNVNFVKEKEWHSC